MKKQGLSVVFVLLLVGSVFWFVAEKEKQAQTQVKANHERLHVVTTNSILEDMVAQVGKDRIDLYSIVDRGIDPHEYEARPSDMMATAKADVVFYNGLNLETGGNGWFKKLVKTAHKSFGKEVYAASEGVRAKHLTTNPEEQDPHAWLDLQNGMQYVRTITSVLKKHDPKNADFYQKNAEAYLKKLGALDTVAQEKYQKIPKKQRVLVTSEGAFKYFSAAYHVTPVYIWEINTEAQGTPEQMKEVLAAIEQSDVKHVFVETSVSPKSMEKVAQETVRPIYSKVFTDSLAKEGMRGDTYYTMMQWNIEKIYEGLTTDTTLN